MGFPSFTYTPTAVNYFPEILEKLFVATRSLSTGIQVDFFYNSITMYYFKSFFRA